MSSEFEVGEYDPNLVEDLRNMSGGDERLVDGNGGSGQVEEEKKKKVRVEKFKVCDQSMTDYIPCLDNAEEMKRTWKSTEKWSKYERHCPGEAKALNCVVPRPKDYKIRIPWPQSRDEVNRSQNFCSLDVFIEDSLFIYLLIFCSMKSSYTEGPLYFNRTNHTLTTKPNPLRTDYCI